MASELILRAFNLCSSMFTLKWFYNGLRIDFGRFNIEYHLNAKNGIQMVFKKVCIRGLRKPRHWLGSKYFWSHFLFMLFSKNKDNIICLRGAKPYTWEIPKKLEKENIKQGDIVLVNCKNTKAPVLVLNVLEIMEEKTKHKKIIKILEKN